MGSEEEGKLARRRSSAGSAGSAADNAGAADAAASRSPAGGDAGSVALEAAPGSPPAWLTINSHIEVALDEPGFRGALGCSHYGGCVLAVHGLPPGPLAAPYLSDPVGYPRRDGSWFKVAPSLFEHRLIAHPGLLGAAHRPCAVQSAAVAGLGPRAERASPPQPALKTAMFVFSPRRDGADVLVRYDTLFQTEGDDSQPLVRSAI